MIVCVLCLRLRACVCGNLMFGFVCSGFNDEYPDYFWFYMMNVRQILIASAATILSQYFVLQLIAISVILIFALIFHVKYWPFEVESLNYAEMYSLAGSSILFTSAVAFNNDQVLCTCALAVLILGPIEKSCFFFQIFCCAITSFDALI